MIRAPALLEDLLRTLNGWIPRIRPAEPWDLAAPLAKASLEEGAYLVESRVLEEPLRALPSASAVCALIADLAQNFYESKPGAFALHCGAFLAGGRLTVLTGPEKAGKSALIARLSAEPELRVVCDDVLPFSPEGEAWALGAPPRLRLPLPEGASPLFRAHVARHLLLRDDLYAYIRPPNLAAFGLMRTPLRVLTVLERREGAQAALRPLSRAAAADHLLRRSMTAPEADPEALRGRLEKLSQDVLRLKLVYSDLEEAADLIRRSLGGGGRVKGA